MGWMDRFIRAVQARFGLVRINNMLVDRRSVHVESVNVVSLEEAERFFMGLERVCPRCGFRFDTDTTDTDTDGGGVGK